LPRRRKARNRLLLILHTPAKTPSSSASSSHPSRSVGTLPAGPESGSKVTAPIIGASRPQHLADAAAALSVSLTTEEIAALEAPSIPHAVAGFR